jgi:hypothetical protein
MVTLLAEFVKPVQVAGNLIAKVEKFGVFKQVLYGEVIAR